VSGVCDNFGKVSGHETDWAVVNRVGLDSTCFVKPTDC